MNSTPQASTSRQIIRDPWETPPQAYSFPVSDVRSVGSCFPTSPPPSRLSPHPFRPCELTGFHRPFTAHYSHLLSRRKQISPGVWSDGTDRVMSAASPTVQAFLATARHDMRLPDTPSDQVFALAALEVFYKIADPVHWMFWNDEKKLQTAEIVNRVSLHRPRIIESSVAWNGTREYMFILATIHGKGACHLFQDKSWYLALNPSKDQQSTRVFSLRKRKPTQTEMREMSPSLDEDESVEGDEPPKKKSRPSSNNVAGNTRARRAGNGNQASGTDIPAIPSPSTSLPSSHPKSSSSYRQVSSSSARLSCDTPTVSSRATTPASLLLAQPAYPGSRNRSTSEASAKTLVASGGRRSASVLSAITAVEALSEEKADKEANKDSNPSELDEPKESAPGMVTRGRANKARVKESLPAKKASTRNRKAAKSKGRN